MRAHARFYVLRRYALLLLVALCLSSSGCREAFEGTAQLEPGVDPALFAEKAIETSGP